MSWSNNMRVYRLETPLLSLQLRGDGKHALRMLPPGADLVASSDGGGTLMNVLYDGAPLQVFAADLAERAVEIDR